MLRMLTSLSLVLGCTTPEPKPEEGSDSGPDQLPLVVDTAETSDSGSVGDTGTLEAAGTVVLGSVSPCEDPLPGPEYEEVGLALEVDTEAFASPAPGGHEDGPSLALADVNADGYPELVLGRQEAGDSRFYVGGPLGFIERSGVMPPGRSPLFVDANSDGILDLMMAGIRPYLITLDEDLSGGMQELPSLDPSGVSSMSTAHDFALADFDQDGVQDIFIVRTASPHGSGAVSNDRMLHLYPDGMQIDMDAVPEEIGLRHGFDGLPFDEDGDGDIDIYLAHDHGATVGASTLLRNNDGVFEDGTDSCFCELHVSAKGVDIADFDRDGQPDMLVTGSPLNTLLSRRDGSWVDVSESSDFREVPGNGPGWGGVFLDIDNDGAVDILLAQGDRWSPGMGSTTMPDGTPASFDVPLRVLRQHDGLFSDVGPELDLDVEGSFRAVIATDINGDGVEDLVVSQVWDRTLIFRSTGCTVNSWIEVEAPLGSKVMVHSAGGVQTDWVRADSGLQATARVPLHFGLGSDTQVSAIVAELPGGDRLVAVGPIDARRRVSLTR